MFCFFCFLQCYWFGFFLFIVLFLVSSVVCVQGLLLVVVGVLWVVYILQQNMGVVVVDVDNGKCMLVVNNIGQLFNLVFVMKLVIMDVVFEIFGLIYIWKIQVYIDGMFVGGVFNGDLIFKGGGDFKLVLENFWLFLCQLCVCGIKDICGNLVLDCMYFVEFSYDFLQFDGDL